LSGPGRAGPVGVCELVVQRGLAMAVWGGGGGRGRSIWGGQPTRRCDGVGGWGVGGWGLRCFVDSGSREGRDRLGVAVTGSVDPGGGEGLGDGYGAGDGDGGGADGAEDGHGLPLQHRCRRLCARVRVSACMTACVRIREHKARPRTRKIPLPPPHPCDPATQRLAPPHPPKPTCQASHPSHPAAAAADAATSKLSS
jgi:hypothetical protein